MESDKEKGTNLSTWLYLRKAQIFVSLSLILFIVWVIRSRTIEAPAMPESLEGCIEFMTKTSCCSDKKAKNNFGSYDWNGNVVRSKPVPVRVVNTFHFIFLIEGINFGCWNLSWKRF
jgi:hypothetical protein